jgi:hypothetical protein
MSENEENLPIENEFIIELVEEIFDQMDGDETFDGLPMVNRQGFGVPESEEGDKKFRLKTKDEIIQRVGEIFNDSNSFEQQRKKYRLEVIKSAENFTLYTIFSGLKKEERKKIAAPHMGDLEIKNFEDFEKETYFDIVRSKFDYHIFLFVLRRLFWDGLEELFPSRLIYHLKEYGKHLFESELNNYEEDSEYSDYLSGEISYLDHQIEIEKKFLTQFGDEKFRELFEFGYKKEWGSVNYN